MKQSTLILAAAAIILLLNSCGATYSPNCTEGSGNIIIETRDLNKFETITMDGWGDVYITIGDVQEIRVETDDDMTDKVSTEVRSGVLTIDLEESFCPTLLNIYLTMTEFRAAILNGSGNIISEEILQKNDISFRTNGSGKIDLGWIYADNIDVRLDGSGNIEIDSMDADNFNFESYGSGFMNLGFLVGEKILMKVGGSGSVGAVGYVDESTITVEGSGHVDFIGLRSRLAGAFALGSGDIKVWAAEKLNVKISGSGDVIYKGDPEIVQDIDGTGKLIKAE